MCRNFLLVAVAGIFLICYKDCFCRGFSRNTFLACFMGPGSFVNYSIFGEILVSFYDNFHQKLRFLGLRFRGL